MSFIIKGFDTDGNCLHCFFQSEDTDRCLLTDDDVPLYGKGHPESCPLVPLPEGHGRLIDGDAVTQEAYRRLLECQKYGNEFEKPYAVIRAIETAKTIVPAEGGGENG